MVYPQIGLDIAVTSKTGNSAKHLQKTAPVQAGIPMKPLEATSFFPEQCHRKQGRGAGKRNRYLSNSSHNAHKYPCKFCGSKDHYATKCNKPQVLSVNTE